MTVKLAKYNILISLSPVWALIFVLCIYSTFSRTLIYCEGSQCQDISSTENLCRIFVIDQPSEQAGQIPAIIASQAQEEGPKETQNSQMMSDLYIKRINWTFLSILYTLSCITAFILSSGLIYQLIYQQFSAKRPRRTAFWLTFSDMLIALALGGFLYHSRNLYMRVFVNLFKITIEKDVSHITQVASLMYAFGFSAIFLIFLAVVTLLMFPVTGSDKQEKEKNENSLQELSERTRQLRWLLYVSAFMLVIAVLGFQATFHWALAYMTDQDLLKKATLFSESLIILWGSLYSLWLAAGYLPAVLVLQYRAESLVKRLPRRNEGKDNLLLDHGFTFSLKSFLLKFIAMISPLIAGFITGPIGEIISQII